MAALSGLGACGALPPAQSRTGLTLATDGIAYQGPALIAAANTFLGSSTGGGAGGGGLFAGGGGSDNIFAPGSDTEYHRTRTRHVGLWAARDQPLGHGVGLTLRAEAGVGQSRYFLPRGVGILTDPMEVSFNDVSAALRMGLGTSVALGPALRLGVTAGAGVRMVRSRTKLRSALIRVTNDHSRTAGFTYAEAGLDIAPRHGPAARLVANVERDADGALGYGLRLDVPF